MIAAVVAALTVGAAVFGVEYLRRNAGPYDSTGFVSALIIFGILVLFWVGFFVGRMSA